MDELERLIPERKHNPMQIRPVRDTVRGLALLPVAMAKHYIADPVIDFCKVPKKGITIVQNITIDNSIHYHK